MASASHHAWFRTLALLAGILAAALLLGLAIGQPWPALTLASLAVVAWHYWKLLGVQQRLTARRRLEPKPGQGIWSALDHLLYRGQTEMRVRKRRLLAMLRAYRAAADVLPDGASLWILAGHKKDEYKLAASFMSFLLRPEVQTEWEQY